MSYILQTIRDYRLYPGYDGVFSYLGPQTLQEARHSAMFREGVGNKNGQKRLRTKSPSWLPILPLQGLAGTS